MDMRHRRILSVVGATALALAALGALALFDAGSMERVPSAETLRKTAGPQPFVQSPSELAGIYQNLDVDALVFTYRAALPAPSALWAKVEAAVEGTGWVRVDEAEQQRTYERTARDNPEQESPGRCSSEQVRMRLDPSSMQVAVAWIQWDDAEPCPELFTDSDGASWARDRLWPKLAEVDLSRRAEDAGDTTTSP